MAGPRPSAASGEPGRPSERARLHRPFVPRRARVVALTIGALALLGSVVLAVVVPGGGLGDAAGFVTLGLLVALVAYRQAGVRVLVDEDGLVVRNLVHTRRLGWAQVVGVSFGGGAPWAQLDLSDGDVLAVMAVQRADGEHGTAEAQRLATLVALHGPRDTDGR